MKKSFIRAALAYALLLTQTDVSASALPAKCPVPVDTIPALKLEIDAVFPGGDDGWRSFLSQNLNPTVPVVKGAPAGKYTVLVQFVVDQTGKVVDIQPLTALGYGMEEEVVRMLKRSPRWKPARLNGEAVNVYRKQPVSFEVVEVKKRRKLF